jgi:hypothetical protein
MKKQKKRPEKKIMLGGEKKNVPVKMPVLKKSFGRRG